MGTDFKKKTSSEQDPVSTSEFVRGTGTDKEISRGYIYRDDLLALKFLTNEQKGLLLTAIEALMFHGAEAEISDNMVNAIFAPIKQHILRDHQAYIEKCAINRKNSNERRCVKERLEVPTTMDDASSLVFHTPSEIIGPQWKPQVVGGVTIPAEEFHLANNLFFWKNYPIDQLKACYDYYGGREERWGPWTTPAMRWNNAICKWTNRTGRERFPKDILLMVGEIFDLATDDAKNCITRRDFNVVVQDGQMVKFTYGRGDQPIRKWFEENRDEVRRIVIKYGFALRPITNDNER